MKNIMGMRFRHLKSMGFWHTFRYSMTDWLANCFHSTNQYMRVCVCMHVCVCAFVICQFSILPVINDVVECCLKLISNRLLRMNDNTTDY